MELGKVLAQLRKDKGLNQRECASALGVSNGAIAMWETNKRQPDIEMLKKISTFYDVSADYILGIKKKSNDVSIFKENFSEKEKNAFTTFCQLSDDNQDIIIGEMKKTLKEQIYEERQAASAPLKNAK